MKRSTIKKIVIYAMDSLMDYYAQLRKEFILLWKTLRKESEKNDEINQRIISFVHLSLLVGEGIRKDARQFLQIVDPYLLGKLRPEQKIQMNRLALKIEQETRAL